NAVNDVEPFVAFGDEPGNLLRRMLQIAVHLDEPSAARVQVERLDRGFLAVVAREEDGADAGLALGEATKQVGRTVPRTGVGEEELEGLADRLHGRDRARRERLDVSLFVEDWNDDAVGDAAAIAAFLDGAQRRARERSTVRRFTLSTLVIRDQASG